MPFPIVTKASSAATTASLTDNARGAAVLLTLAITWPQGMFDQEDSLAVAAQVYGDVRQPLAVRFVVCDM